MINYFRSVTFPLIRFYLETPPFSVEDLLNYNEYAIRDFAVHDKDLRFHKWLIENKCTMPPALVGNCWGNIPCLCDFSGMEYLNREIFSFQGSQQDKQTKLNKLTSTHCYRDKERSLRDCLAPSSEVTWNTVEDRFLKFKENAKVY